MKHIVTVSMLITCTLLLTARDGVFMGPGPVMPPPQVSASVDQIRSLLTLDDQTMNSLKLPMLLDSLQQALANDLTTIKATVLDRAEQLKRLIVVDQKIKKDIELFSPWARGTMGMSVLDMAVLAADKDFVTKLVEALPAEQKTEIVSRSLRQALAQSIVDGLIGDESTNQAQVYFDIARVLIQNGAVTGIVKLDQQLKNLRSIDDLIAVVMGMAFDTVYTLIEGACRTEAISEQTKNSTHAVVAKIKQHRITSNITERAKQVHQRVKRGVSIPK